MTQERAINPICKTRKIINIVYAVEFSFSLFSVLGKQAKSCASRLPEKTTPRRHGEILHGSTPLQYVPRDCPDAGGNSNETISRPG